MIWSFSVSCSLTVKCGIGFWNRRGQNSQENSHQWNIIRDIITITNSITAECRSECAQTYQKRNILKSALICPTRALSWCPSNVRLLLSSLLYFQFHAPPSQGSLIPETLTLSLSLFLHFSHSFSGATMQRKTGGEKEKWETEKLIEWGIHRVRVGS